jgi:hypothetical protein
MIYSGDFISNSCWRIVINNNCFDEIPNSVKTRDMIPNCNHLIFNEKCHSLTKFCYNDCYNTNSILLNWDYYRLFYKNNTCNNSNILEQIIKTVQSVAYPN